jgi:DNA polymerase-1
MERIILIDGNALIHRSFHAIPPLTAPDGTLTNAVYGFFSTLLGSINRFQPEYCLVAFDLPGKTFRDDLFAEYKAKRAKTPQELYDQIPIIKTILNVFEIPYMGVEGFEADDIIGTLAKQVADFCQAGHQLEAIIVTGDQDAIQLVNDCVKIFTMKNSIKDTVLLDEKAVVEKYGFKPVEMIDYKALRGDPSDNIPGVAGIGDKTACQLIDKHHNIETIFKNIDNIPDKIKNKLVGQEEIATLSKTLATISTEVPIKLDLKMATLHDFDQTEVENIFTKFAMTSLIRRLPQSSRPAGPNIIQETLL